MIERADYVIDIGPKAGKYGGEIIRKDSEKSETPYYYSDVHEWRNENEVPAKRREGNGKFLKLTGATGNNENVSIELPLGKMICVTGFRRWKIDFD
jgi:excinuclease ABC subunit A